MFSLTSKLLKRADLEEDAPGAEALMEKIDALTDYQGRIKLAKLFPWIIPSKGDMEARETIPDGYLKYVTSQRRNVPLNKVESDQEYIFTDKLSGIMNNPGMVFKITPPQVIHMPSGRYLIEDGNHRVSAALMEGADFMEMNVVEYQDCVNQRTA
jgi:hypothetical protein